MPAIRVHVKLCLVMPRSTTRSTWARGVQVGPTRRAALLDRRPRKFGFALFHHVSVVERIPGQAGICFARVRFVMSYEIADKCSGHPELHIALEVFVIVHIDLTYKRFKPRFEDQGVHVRRPIRMPVLRGKETPDDAICGDRVARGFYGAEPEASIAVRDKFAA